MFYLSSFILIAVEWKLKPETCSNFKIGLGCDLWWIWIYSMCGNLRYHGFTNTSFALVLKFNELLFPALVYILLFTVEFIYAYFVNHYYFIQLVNDFLFYSLHLYSILYHFFDVSKKYETSIRLWILV